MSYKSDKKHYIKFSNIAQHVTNKVIRNKTTFRVKGNGQMFYIQNGEEIPKDEFEAKYPIELKPHSLKGSNFDKTKNWLHGEKSY